MGDYKNSDPEYGFTQNNLGPVYKPIMNILGLKWENNDDIGVMIHIHWIIIFLVVWYILCFKLRK